MSPQSRPRVPRAWQRMLSGRRLDLLDPSPLDIEIEDIALGLSRVARWNGQTHGSQQYSVAEHSLLVESLLVKTVTDAPQQWRLAALLHDAPEYVIGDMISPFKSVIGNNYQAVEIRLQQAIHLRFGLPAILPSKVNRIIKRADKLAAHLEAIELAGFSKTEARRFFGPAGESTKLTIIPSSAQEAKSKFLEKFRQLFQ